MREIREKLGMSDDTPEAEIAAIWRMRLGLGENVPDGEILELAAAWLAEAEAAEQVALARESQAASAFELLRTFDFDREREAVAALEPKTAAVVGRLLDMLAAVRAVVAG
jgi:hypothetical protein